MPTSISLSITSLTCTQCHAKMNFAAFKAGNGQCSCGASLFDVMLIACKKSMPDPPAPLQGVPVGKSVVLVLAPDPITRANRLVDRLEQYAISEKTCELKSLPGAAALELASLPPEKAWQWVVAWRKETAKLNPRPDQGLCKVCGGLFTKGLRGHTAEGFCSRQCRDGMLPREAPPEPVVATTKKRPPRPMILSCPKCDRPVKIQKSPGSNYHKCSWCGAEFAV